MIAVAHPLFGREEEAAVLQVLASGQLAQGKVSLHLSGALRIYAR